MNDSTQAICHCIIGHPSAAKFLVIKHADGWSPPVALVSDGQSMAHQVGLINRGMLENYGFMTVALRQLAASPGYHCVELEMLSQHGRSGLQAVWVGKKEYAQFRRSAPGQFDPMAAWLEEREKGITPENRPRWEKKNWCAGARDWIQKGLRSLNMPQTGPVEQVRAFRTPSCVLRAPTSRGYVYFKACQDVPPAEAALTRELAEKWPHYVDKPLMVDAKRNWMLSRDYGDPRLARPAYADYPRVASALADIQLGSLDAAEKWSALGCPAVSLDTLTELAGNIESLAPILAAGGGDMAITEREIEQLAAIGLRNEKTLERLSGYAIPDMLVHPDLWFTNIARKPDGLFIMDWSGTVIAHPFFSLMKLIRFRELETEARMPVQGDPAADPILIDSIINAYLEGFSPFESPERLREAMTLVREVHGLWRLFTWRQALSLEEDMSVSYQSVARHLQRIARSMIGAVPV